MKKDKNNYRFIVDNHGRRIRLEGQTDLSLLSGRSVLVVLDEQNLTRGAADLLCEMNYSTLTKLFHESTLKSSLHIFIAASTDNQIRPAMFRRMGLTVHVKHLRYRHGRPLDRNIDNLFAFWTGGAIRRTAAEVVVLGSGDFGLAGELAVAISQCRRRRPLEVMSLSLPGSTALDLNSQSNSHITANLEIGLDCLQRQNQKIFPTERSCRGNYRCSRMSC